MIGHRREIAIQVQIDGGEIHPKHIDAECVSGLALHPSTWGRGWWSITHIRSGLRIPIQFQDRQAAEWFMEALIYLPIDWTGPVHRLWPTKKLAEACLTELDRLFPGWEHRDDISHSSEWTCPEVA